MKEKAVLVALLAVTTSARIASAQSLSVEREIEMEWYGYQTLAANIGAVGIFMVGGFAESEPVMVSGLVAFGLGPAVVHWANGNIERGLVSVCLQIGAPLLGSAIGISFYDHQSGSTGGDGILLALIGALSGASIAVILDASVLAWKEAPNEEETPLAVAPLISVNGDEKSFGLVARF